MSSFKSNPAFYWVLIVVVVSVGVFAYLVNGDAPKTTPKIELSYYEDEFAIADAVGVTLAQDLKKSKFYWIGVEPEKNEYLDVAAALIKKIKTQQSVQKIIVDQELGLKNDQLKALEFTEVISVKENLYSLGEKLQDLEKNEISYVLVSASIYTNTLLKKNPLHVLKEKYNINPLTFSFAYFSTSGEDEKNMIFPCRTEDQTGTADWGCVVVNKARFARRKMVSNSPKPWVGLMDLSSENNYILLLKKNVK